MARSFQLEVRRSLTDQGLQALASMTSLDYFVASGPRISAAGLASLQAKLENGARLG